MATPKTAKKAASARVDAARVLNHLRAKYNPIRNLSPEYLARALDAHERGELKLAAMLWDTIERRDDRTRTVARKRKKAVGRFGWNVVLRDENGRANKHKEAVEFFLTNLVAADAINGDYRRGWSGLCAQMLDAVGKGRAVHEVLWQPSKDGLTAEFRQVPLWFFESKTGKLRFLESDVAMDGAPLDEGGWMTTVDDGIMEANSIAYLFKVQPLRDWLIFCEKFGIPAVVGKTNAAKGSPEWQALEEAVANFMNDWGAVMNLESAIEFIKAGESSSNLPMPGLVDRCDRVIAALWRGGDLSTMSSQDGEGHGASLQGDEGDILLQDDAELIAETLNAQVLPWITRYQFGDEPMVEIQIPIPERSDSTKELEVDKFFLGNGLALSARDLRERYGRREPDPDDVVVGQTQDGKAQDTRPEPEETEDRDNEAGDRKPEEGDELANAYNPNQPREKAGTVGEGGRGIGGRFARNPLAANAIEALRTDGGFTLTPEGRPRTSGYAVAPEKDTEMVIPLDKITLDDIRAYAKKHYKTLQLPNAHLGGWVYEGNAYLDISLVVNTREEAYAIARASDQIAFFHLDTFTEYKTNEQPEYTQGDEVANERNPSGTPVFPLRETDREGIVGRRVRGQDLRVPREERGIQRGREEPARQEDGGRYLIRLLGRFFRKSGGSARDAVAYPTEEFSNEQFEPAAPSRVPGNAAELMRVAMAEDAGPLANAIAEAMWTEDEALMRAKLRLVLARWPELTSARPEAGRAVWMEILSQAIADGFDEAEAQTKEGTKP